MIRWTTPTIKCNIPDGLEFDFILLTLKQSGYIIEKEIYPGQVEDNSFNVLFTQEETSRFRLFTPIEAQLNVMKNGIRIATNISSLCIERNLHDEEIGETPTPAILEITENGMYDVANYTFANVNIEVPTRTSQLINDSGFITSSDVPTRTSQLINNSNFQTDVDVERSISNHNESAISHLDIRQLVSTEVANRESADTDLQSQIDALTSASDVTDIVGTYQELEEYDTSSLTNSDIIVVLDDSTHNDTKSYYRWDSEQEEFNYVGSDGEYYTKSVVDSLFVPQTRQVNGHALSSDITLTYQDVGALSDTTHIPNKQDIKNVIDDEMAIMKYECLVNGIEQLLPTNTSVPTTTPLLADIQYPDELRNNQYFNYRISPTTQDGEAEIKKIKGNTLVFNQLVQNGNFADTTGWSLSDSVQISVSNGILTATIGSTHHSSIRLTKTNLTMVSGKKYLFMCDIKPTKNINVRVQYPGIATDISTQTMTANVWGRYSSFATMTANNNLALYYNTGDNLTEGDTVQFRNCVLFDLSLMGLDNLTSVPDFTNLFPLPYYDYNAGSLLSFNGTGIKTTGKNLLNPQVFNNVGNGSVYQVNDDGSITINQSDGYAWTTLNTFHLKKGNYILTRSTPNGLCDIRFGYENFATNHLIANQLASYPFAVTQDTDVKIKLGYSYSSYPFTTNIMIRFADTDDTFEPYTENTIDLPISTFFPNGMKSAGTIYDELTPTKAITRIGAVDLGNLEYVYDSTVPRFYTSGLANIIKKPSTSDIKGNAISDMYEVLTTNQFFTSAKDKSMMIATNGNISFINTTYSSASAFKSAMSGVYLYYELKDEVIVDLPQYSDLTELAENVTSEYIILRDANNVKYKVSVDTSGNLIATPI